MLTRFRIKILTLSSQIRIGDWRNSFLPLIAGWCYCWIMYFDIPISWLLTGVFFLFLTTAAGFAATGYCINEFFDIKQDALSGKPNRLAEMTGTQIALLFSVLLSVTLLPWLLLPADRVTFWLLSSELVLFLLYSLPFPRLKAIWFLSVIIDTLYAYVIPFFISYHTFALYRHQYVVYGPVIWFATAIGLLGCRNMLQHQYQDMAHDSRFGMITLPQKTGRKNLSLLMGIMIVLEGLFILLFFLSHFHQSWLLLFAPVYVSYMVLLYIYVFRTFPDGENIIRFSNNNFYQVYMPLLCLLLLVLRDFRWSVILAVHVVLLVPYHIYKFYFYRIRHMVRWAKLWLIRITSFCVNYLIYYVFIVFGVDLKKENISAFDYLKKKCRQL